MGRNWAITIGINGYRNLQRLNYAQQDAEAMRQLFSQELDFQHVYHFTDDSPPIPQDYGSPLDSQPTYTTLRRFLRTRFEQPFLRDGDNLWFFFAGHGIRDQNRDYLMPMDGDRSDLDNSAISINYISERLRQSGADNIILLIDACRSLEGRRDGLGIGQEKQQGVITLFSCSPEESAYEIAELQQGTFTHVLLDSLRLQGEGNCATVERLYQRLRYYVPQITQRYRGISQTPYGVIEPPTKNHLILLPRRATLDDINALKKDALTAEVQRDVQRAKQYWVRVLVASPGDPEAIEGIERLVQVAATPQSPTQVMEAKTETGRGVEAPAKAASSQTPPPVPQDYRVEQFATPSRVNPPTPKALPRYEFEVVTVNAQGQISQREQRSAEYRREDLGRGISLDLVLIPGSAFMMGSPEGEGDADERPQHQVFVPPFLMGKYPVTQAQWKAVAALPKVALDLNADLANFEGDNLPVERVSWDEAVEFCQRLSKQTGRKYRLPSEAEWEYACRAGTTTPFHFGETITTDLANYDGSSAYGSGPKGQYRDKTTEVGSFKTANAFGLYDMHGNVWDWCLDYWHESYEGAPTDGSAWTTGGDDTTRLLRGDSWFYGPGNCRSAYRGRVARDDRNYDIGFRLVCASSWAL
jgi:formylglycine-generating enzyme required for sulfatase activity/uncharacterized caspase-like protein